jgi:hypothetical protein
MRLNLLSDAHWEAKVGKILDELSSTGYRQLFEAREYGKGLGGITVVFMCQEPSLNLKQRVKFAKQDKKLYIDIMLHLDEMKMATPDVRRRIVVERLADEVPAILHKYSFEDFDEPRFVEDLKSWLTSIA